MSGVDLSVRKGKYGEKGKASVENIPPARADAIGFYDSSTQELWLFGGAFNTNGETPGMHCK